MARVRPHFKSHVSMRTHRKTVAMYADNDLLATYHRIGHLMVERYASKTGDTIQVHLDELEWITGKGRRDAAVRLLHRLEQVSPIEVEILSDIGGTSVGRLADVRWTSGERRADVGRTSRERPGNIFAITLRNFAKKHGMTPKNVDGIEDTREKSEDRRGKIEDSLYGSADSPAIPGLEPPPSEPPRDRVQAAWNRGVQAAVRYRTTASRWKLTEDFRKKLNALLQDHPDAGEDVFAWVVDGYRFARRKWEGIEDHFSPKTLLVPANREEYIAAFHDATSQGLHPPFPPESKADSHAQQTRNVAQGIEEQIANAGCPSTSETGSDEPRGEVAKAGGSSPALRCVSSA